METIEYSRRNFLKQNMLAGTGIILFGGFGSYACSSGSQLVDNDSLEENTIDLKLDELYKRYHSDLFDHFLPNMDKWVIDHEFGGFMCSVDIESGELKSTNKSAWYEGRGLWTYSFLYNNLDKNPKYLEIARKSKDFILKSQPAGNRFWTSSFTREGQPLTNKEGDIYSSLFVAEGLAEYSKASGESKYLEQAKKIILTCMTRYDSPDYGYNVTYLSSNAPVVEAPRVLGHWMIFLRSITQILEIELDKDMEALADRCIEAILDYHLNPEYNLLNELLNHDLSRPNNEFKDFVYSGHGIETLWMLMFEAGRRKDRKLFEDVVALFKRHVTVAHDVVYGGYFRSLDHVDNNIWKLDKVLWLQEEILVGSLYILEHTGDTWAKRCFEETLEYVHQKFDRKGNAFWTSGGDRYLNDYNKVRAEHYHHPRHLMLNLLALNRISERKGRLSNLFGM